MVSALVSANGYLVSAGENIRVWSTSTWTQTSSIEMNENSYPISLAYNSNLNLIAAGLQTFVVKPVVFVWDFMPGSFLPPSTKSSTPVYS